MADGNQAEVFFSHGILPVIRPAPTAPPAVQIRRFPRSANSSGYAADCASRDVQLAGPFGYVTALVIRNQTTVTLYVYEKGGNLSDAIVVAPGEKRRLEFDTPTDSDGVRVTNLMLTVAHSGTDTENLYWLEVE